SMKSLLRICSRFRWNISIYISCIFLITYVVPVWYIFGAETMPNHTVQPPSTSRTSILDDLLDRCMLTDTPCVPDIERAMNRYFSKLKRKFSMLLTYHPKIDCEHGRYLLLNDSPEAHIIYGAGSQLMWYLGVLNVAYALNLTLVHLEWT
ncbi:unnamed protein product, partial [Rotaria magnacalcarata]